MLARFLCIFILAATGISVFAQNRIQESPDKHLRAVIIPVGEKGYESRESRVEIRTSRGRLLKRKSFFSKDHNHGEGVGRAEWSSDRQFFVFNTSSSGGHQPWHVATYFYSRQKNRVYSLDAFVGPITSDFKLERRDTVVTTRFNFKKNEEREPVRVRLQNLTLN
jgi:hypothetical protein